MKKRPTLSRGDCAAIFLGLSGVWISACGGPADRGQHIYETNCKSCHEDTTLQLRTKPPSLHGLFTRKNLPSGAPATDEQVRRTIQEGKRIMPPFAHVLDKENLDDLIAYLHKK